MLIEVTIEREMRRRKNKQTKLLVKGANRGKRAR